MSIFSIRSLKSIAAPALIAAGVLLPGLALASDWDLDAAHTRIAFSVRHMMVSNTRGHFAKFAGTLNLDDKDVTKSVLNVDIDASSINTENEKRDTHLKSADFFDVAKFPKLTFKSTKIEKKGDGLAVTGDLSMHGVTKAVVLDVSPLSAEYKDPWGGVHRGTHATTKVNRKDFGLVWNKALGAGGILVGDEVAIELDIELIPKAPAAPPPAKK